MTWGTYIWITIIALIVIILIVLFYLSNSFLVYEIRKEGSQYIILMVNRFKTNKKWILSKGSQEGVKISENITYKGKYINTLFLHGGYKKFFNLGKLSQEQYDNIKNQYYKLN